MNRRDFLFTLPALAEEPTKRDTLVILFLRGGCDALTLLPPVAGEDRKIYEEERPNLKVETAAVLPLDNRVGLHPSAQGLHDLYKSKKLAVVVAAGMTSKNRSHFDAQAFMELGTPDKKTTTSGWIARHLDNKSRMVVNPLTATAIGPLIPTSLMGCLDSTSVVQPRRFGGLGGDKAVQKDMVHALQAMYRDSTPLTERTQAALSVMSTLGGDDIPDYVPAPGIEYPKNDLGGRMKTLAQMLKMNLGIQVATLDMGGWDTHRYQGQGSQGTFAKQVEQLSGSIQAFAKDMEGHKITTVVMSEFGRRLRENANRGTDHGHGGMMMVLGPEVNGGRVFGHWPGLKTDQLYERADLAVTTDFRQVLSEVLLKRRGERHISAVFPEYTVEKDLGLLRT